MQKLIFNMDIHANPLPSTYITNELLVYAKQGHAEIVYRKCLKAGKRILAERIKRKYKLQGEQHDDMVTAFGFALACVKRDKQK